MSKRKADQSSASSKQAKVDGGDVQQSAKDMFSALDTDGSGTVSTAFLKGFLERSGLGSSDPRLQSLFDALDGECGSNLSLAEFARVIAPCSTLVHKACNGELRVPDFAGVTAIIDEVFKAVEPNTSGENAQYIPQLAQVDPNQFAIAITTVDGQQYRVGDADTPFCIQSCSKPLSYLLALDEFGADYVHKHVGTEPSGHAFNHVALKECEGGKGEIGSPSAIPHNPCINAGAMMTVSMVYPHEKSRQQRLSKVIDFWKRLSGGPDAPIGYDDETYKSESATADRNWSLGFLMREEHAFPPCFSYDGKGSLRDTLELYFQICSMQSTCTAMSSMAACLANGGLQPLTGERVAAAESVRCALPLMLTCGMYDYSGQWAFEVGVPAKSGVGGCVFMVIPNVCGIAVWSPRLDAIGNSARGVHVASELVKRVQLHNFEVFSGLSRKKVSLTMRKNEAKQAEIGEFLFAAQQGDCASIASQLHAGTNVGASDYDGRTALHLAATEGHEAALQLLVDAADAAAVSSRDRWGGTPLSDALHNGHDACASLLRGKGAAEGETKHWVKSRAVEAHTVSREAPQLLFAAAEGDIDELVRLNVSGADLHASDYDGRTALHLAASCGNADAVRYILHARGGWAERPKDRFNATALDDAVREGHTECAKLLE